MFVNFLSNNDTNSLDILSYHVKFQKSGAPPLCASSIDSRNAILNRKSGDVLEVKIEKSFRWNFRRHHMSIIIIQYNVDGNSDIIRKKKYVYSKFITTMMIPPFYLIYRENIHYSRGKKRFLKF